MSKELPDSYEAYEPYAAEFRKRGFDAVADDAGHANYCVRLTLPDHPEVEEIILSAAEGSWGYNLIDHQYYTIDGGSFPDLALDAPVKTVVDRFQLVLNQELEERR